MISPIGSGFRSRKTSQHEQLFHNDEGFDVEGGAPTLRGKKSQPGKISPVLLLTVMLGLALAGAGLCSLLADSPCLGALLRYQDQTSAMEHEPWATTDSDEEFEDDRLDNDEELQPVAEVAEADHDITGERILDEVELPPVREQLEGQSVSKVEHPINPPTSDATAAPAVPDTEQDVEAQAAMPEALPETPEETDAQISAAAANVDEAPAVKVVVPQKKAWQSSIQIAETQRRAKGKQTSRDSDRRAGRRDFEKSGSRRDSERRGGRADSKRVGGRRDFERNGRRDFERKGRRDFDRNGGRGDRNGRGKKRRSGRRGAWGVDDEL